MKVVLTGGPCCGKTTVIQKLKERGYNCLDEIAREVIEKNKNSEEKFSLIDLQKKIFKEQINREYSLSKDLNFLDRGLIDNFAYSIHLTKDLIEEIKDMKIGDLTKRYDSVFVLDLLPFENDGLRIESGHYEAKHIHDRIIESYKIFGYNPISVPTFNGSKEKAIESRVNFILNYVEHWKWSKNEN